MAGFLEHLARGAEFRAATTLANPAGWLMDALAGSATSSGKRVTTSNAMGLISVWAAETMISEAIGLLPFKVYRKLDGNPVAAEQHRAWKIIHDKPNSYTTAQRFWAAVGLNILHWGNSFLEFGRDEQGLVDELYLESPDGMNVVFNPETRAKSFWKDTPQGRKRWSDEQMLHIMGPSRDGLIGMSPISECREALGIAMTRDEFEGAFYKRGAVLAGWIEYPGQLGEQGLKNLSQGFAAKYGGAGKSGGTPILEEGAMFHDAQSPLKDMQFVESRQMSRTDIATMFKMPPAFLGGTTGDSLTYSTIESNKMHFSDFAVAPPAMTIAKSLSASSALFPQQNAFYVEPVFEGLLRADAKTRGEFYKMLWEVEAISDEEIRSKENYPPKEQAQGDFKSDAAKKAAPDPPPAPPENGDGNGQPSRETLLERLGAAEATGQPSSN